MATKKFPLAYLQRLPITSPNSARSGLVSRTEDGKPSMVACVWIDREQRYFISNAYGLTPGSLYIRKQWRREDQAPNAPTTQVTPEVPQPKVAEVYYDSCGKIDQHNCDRQDTLGVERKLVTHFWDKRVGLTIFSMIAVNLFCMYNCTVQNSVQQCRILSTGRYWLKGTQGFNLHLNRIV